jgi:hypothetical protein
MIGLVLVRDAGLTSVITNTPNRKAGQMAQYRVQRKATVWAETTKMIEASSEAEAIEKAEAMFESGDYDEVHESWDWEKSYWTMAQKASA